MTIDDIIAQHNADEIKVELMYYVYEDEHGQYYIKDGVRIDLIDDGYGNVHEFQDFSDEEYAEVDCNI